MMLTEDNGVLGIFTMFHGKKPYIIPDIANETDENMLNMGLDRTKHIPPSWVGFDNARAWRESGKVISAQELLDGRYKGMTLQVIGSGPSVSEHLEKLKRKKKNVVTMGLNSGNLYHPWDIAFVAEPAALLEWYDKFDTTPRILLLNVMANMDILKSKIGEYHGFYSNIINMHDKFWAENGYPFLYSGSCTPMTPMHFAVKAGFKRVELYGCDFAYKDDEYYAGQGMKTMRPADGNALHVFGFDGEVWISTEMLTRHCKNFVATCKWVARSGIKVVNKSTGVLGYYL